MIFRIATVNDIEKGRLDFFGDRPSATRTNDATVEFADRGDLRSGTGKKRFVGNVDVVPRDLARLDRDAQIRADDLNRAPGNAVKR